MTYQHGTDKEIEEALEKLEENVNVWLVSAISRWLHRVFDNGNQKAIIYKTKKDDKLFFSKDNNKSMLIDETIIFTYGSFVNSNLNMDVVEIYNHIKK